MPGFLKLFFLRHHFEKRFSYAAALMDSLDVNDTFERLITNLKVHFCQAISIYLKTNVEQCNRQTTPPLWLGPLADWLDWLCSGEWAAKLMERFKKKYWMMGRELTT